MTADTLPIIDLYQLRDQEGRPLKLAPRIGAGHEGSVHPVTSHPGMVAKIMLNQPVPQRFSHKILHMTTNPPPIVSCSAFRIAWPTAAIISPEFAPPVGFLMPHMSQDRYHEIGAYFNPARRSRMAEARRRPYTYLHLLAMAQNLAHAVDHLHRQGHLIADLNSRNVLADDRARIALIDADSFEVNDPATGEVHHSAVHTPEYTPPRLQGPQSPKRQRSPEDDHFSLAVMIYQLLFQGNHPFAGTYRHDHGHHVQTLAERISVASFVHGPQTKYKHRPSDGAAMIWNASPFKKLFQAAFRRRGSRTTARQWADAIQEHSHQTHRCVVNPLHHSLGYGPCIWCRYQDATGYDPFPQD